MKRLKHLAVSAALLGLLTVGACADSTAPTRHWYDDQDRDEYLDQADQVAPDDQQEEFQPERKDRDEKDPGVKQ